MPLSKILKTQYFNVTIWVRKKFIPESTCSEHGPPQKFKQKLSYLTTDLMLIYRHNHNQRYQKWKTTV